MSREDRLAELRAEQIAVTRRIEEVRGWETVIESPQGKFLREQLGRRLEDRRRQYSALNPRSPHAAMDLAEYRAREDELVILLGRCTDVKKFKKELDIELGRVNNTLQMMETVEPEYRQSIAIREEDRGDE